jgi:hypothetical protein
MTISELKERLDELPSEWRVTATRSGGSLEVWDPSGPQYGYVFTDGRPTRLLTDHRAEFQRRPKGGPQ